MAEATAAEIKRPPDAVYKVVNPILGLIVRSPLHGVISKRLMLLEFTGRKSGKRFRTPVGYVLDGDDVVLSTQSRWKANFRGDTRVALWLGGRRRTGTAQLIDDSAGMADAFATILRGAPDFARFTGINPGPDGRPVPDDLERARAQGYVAIRIKLD
jgi:hypothetical protein